MDLTGTSVIVTGAGRGLGRAYAAALGAAGASVVVNARDEDAAGLVVDEVRRAGGTAVAEVLEVGTAEAAERLVAAAVEAFGRLDALVCNAGIVRDRVLWKMSDDEFDEVIRVNLRGTFTCGRAAAIRMREQGGGGSIILTGSPSGQRGNFGQSNYAASKGAVAAMARTWAAELARADITVNAVLPTAATRMAAAIPLFAPYVEGLGRGEPIPPVVRRAGAFGPPEDAAGLVVFLASPAARRITGQCIGVGGDRISLWSVPQEIALAYHDGGWSADDLAEAFEPAFAANLQRFGIRLPDIPEHPSVLAARERASSSNAVAAGSADVPPAADRTAVGVARPSA